MKEWVSFVFSKKFVKHFLMIAVAFIIFVLLLFKWFDIYTRHGMSLTLNDLNELTLEQAAEVLESKKLNYFIVDSSSFNPDFLPHAVIQQNPAPESKVKKGRTVYLWLNASVPPYKPIPDVEGRQIDEAYERFAQLGFKIGEITYKPDADVSNGEPIRALYIDGVKVGKNDSARHGTIIDIVINVKPGGNKVDVPLLLGKTLAEAEFLMGAAELNLGTMLYDEEGLIDSASAVIYKQLPDYANEPIRVGTTIDVWLIQDLPSEVSQRLKDIELEKQNSSTLSETEEEE